MRAAFFPRVRSMNPLKLLPINTNFSYERLPGYESTNGSPYSSISLKKYRWRSPSPGGERFSFTVPKISFARFLVVAITSILCVGLIIVGGVRSHNRRKNQKAPPREAYPWEKFPRYVINQVNCVPVVGS